MYLSHKLWSLFIGLLLCLAVTTKVVAGAENSRFNATHLLGVEEIQMVYFNQDNSQGIAITGTRLPDSADSSGINFYLIDALKSSHEPLNLTLTGNEQLMWLNEKEVLYLASDGLYTIEYPFVNGSAKVVDLPAPLGVNLVNFRPKDSNNGKGKQQRGTLYFSSMVDPSSDIESTIRWMNAVADQSSDVIEVNDTPASALSGRWLTFYKGINLERRAFSVELIRDGGESSEHDKSNNNSITNDGNVSGTARQQVPRSPWSIKGKYKDFNNHLPASLGRHSLLSGFGVSADEKWIFQILSSYIKPDTSAVLDNYTIYLSNPNSVSSKDSPAAHALNIPGSLYLSGVSFSPDSRYLAWIQNVETDPSVKGYTSAATMICIYDVKTRNQQCLGKDLDKKIVSFSWFPTSDGKSFRIFATVMVGTSGQIYEFSLDPSTKPKVHLTGNFISNVWATPKYLLYYNSSPTHPMSIYAMDVDRHVTRPVLDLNKHLFDDIDMWSTEVFKYKSNATAVGDEVVDGDVVEIEGLLYLPPDYGKDKGKKYPLVLYPHTRYDASTAASWDSDILSPQIIASHGFVVSMINFQGSNTYGARFANASYQNWAVQPALDMETGIDYLCGELDQIDCDKLLGVGRSYGAYLGIFMGTRNKYKFKGWVLETPIYDLEEFYRTTMWDGVLETQFGGPPSGPWSNPEIQNAYRRNNPANFADKLKTQAFIKYSSIPDASDYHVGEGHSLAYYSTLRTNNVPAQYAYYENDLPQNMIKYTVHYLRWLSQRAGISLDN